MKRVIKVGCCGFPIARRRYYENLECIEINATFYRVPKVELARKWKNEAPRGFEFILKAWQLITHPYGGPTYRRLFEPVPFESQGNLGFFKPTREVFAAWKRTKDFADELGCKKIVFQTPPSFKPKPENIDNLKAFFKKTGGRGNGIKFLWEPRGDWPEAVIKSICRDTGLVHCVDPNHKNAACGAFNYFRLHGSYDGEKINYDYNFTRAELKKILKYCDKPLNYVMFDHFMMYRDALEFRKMASESGSVQGKGGRS